MGRTLIVMRHATAEPYAAEDELRELTEGGVSAARAGGEWLTRHGLVPNEVWVSAATRTRQTWDEVRSAMGDEADPTVHVEAAIYQAGPESVLDLVSLSDPASEVVLVLGHNPTVSYLSHLLDDGHPDMSAWKRVSEGFPPAAMAVFDVPVEWVDLGIGSVHLRDFAVGGRDD